MNKIFKTVWSAVRGCVAVVSELCSACGSGRNSGKRPRRAKPRLSNRRFVPSVLVAALAGFFVSVNAFCAVVNFNQHNIKVDALTESGEWKILEMSFHNLVQRGDPFVNKTVLDALLTTGEKYFHTVYGAYLRSSLIGSQGVYNLYEADGNNFYVNASSEPEDLNFNAEEWSVDEMGFNGIAGNFTVKDGKTLVLFGEAPLNGSYLGEGKTGTVNNGTLVFGLPYEFSGFENGLSSGNTGELVLEDGANLEFRNGVYSTTRIGIQPRSNVRIVVKDSADVTMQGGGSSDVDAVVSGEGFVGIIENIGSGNLTITGGFDYSAGKVYNAFIGGIGTISNIGTGTLTISGGSGVGANGIGINAAYSGSTGEILNAGYGALKISGGIGEYAFGIGNNGAYSGSTGKISNTSARTLTISGGSGSHANGIDSNAINSGNGTISNEGEGTLTIMGGSGDYAHGIGANASGSGSNGTILNEGEGTLTITAGSGNHAYGIEYNGNGNGNGTISNTGAGTLTITGGSNHEAHAIFYNASGFGSIGTFSNTGKGTLTIMGGEGSVATGIHSNAYYGGSGTISNIGSGKLTITGGSGSAASGIYFNAEGENSTAIITNTGDEGVLTISGGSSGNGIDFNALDGGKGIISNTGRGTLIITGSSESGADGIYRNAYRNESTATISNTGSGTLTITGGSGNNADGISINASVSDPLSEETVNVIISNEGAGILNITGGSGEGSYGIRSNANNRGTGTITNGVSGTLNILGNVDSGSCGIRDMTSGTVSTGRLENAGEMNLNANAIGSFGDGDVLVTNYSTGTVNAEVEAIFEKAGGSATVDSEIVVLNPEDGMNGNTAVNGFGSSGTSIAWDLKNDWRLHSKWEDGGVLNITDVVEGSLAAQQIEAAFTSKFGNGTQLNFIGEDDWASEGVGSSEDAFTASIGNALIDQGYAGQIVTNFNLVNSDTDGSAQALTVGAGEGQVIKDSLGFRQVEGVSSLTVNSGKYFALIGLPAGGELIEGGAPVTLDNGTLMLGVTPAQSAREDSSTAGTLETVTMANNSNIEVENMWVRIDTVKGNGSVALTDTGRLYVKDLNVEGDVTNDGTLSADSVTISGGTLTTTKTLKSEGAISVASNAVLVADGILASDTLDVKGSLKRGQSISIYTGKAAMELMRERHADVAAELDRLEAKTEVSTLSVLDRIVAQSMKKTEGTETEQEGSGKDDESASPSASTGAAPSVRRTAPILPQDAQAFAAFDAVNRVVSSVEGDATPDGHGMWAKLLTGESEFGVRSGSKFEVDSDGAVLGAEARLNPNWKIGAAFSYLDGEIDSGRSKSDWKSYGLTAYAHYRAGDFALKGSAGWLRGTTEATDDLDADVWHIGIRSEYGFAAGPVTVTPFFGARMMSGSFDGMPSQTVVSVPLGLKIAGKLSTNGWTLKPALEASYARSIGDTKAEDVRYLPKDAVAGALSLKAEKSAWSGELSFRGATGSNDYEDRAFTAKVGLKF